MMPSIVIIDDHVPFRAEVRVLLERGGFLVIGEAGDSAAAVAEVRRLRPDVVLLDIQLPGDDGFVTCERIFDATEGDATSPVVVLTSGRPLATFRGRLATSRAAGFVAKTDITAETVRALVASDRGT